MRTEKRKSLLAVGGVAIALLLLLAAPSAVAADDPPELTEEIVAMESETDDGVDVDQPETAKPKMEIYGFAMTDVGYRTGQINPDWFDVIRPTKMPAYENEYGADGNAYFSVRQTRFGVKSWFPTKLGELYTIFEFELFGVGADAGQTTFRLRHAYGELGHFGAGQTWSPFMDIGVFPNSLEYWGPSGMVFFRNVQVRWMPIKGDTRLTFALERPGASGDQGQYDENIALDEVSARFPLPDLSAEYHLGTDWGYIETRRHPASDRVGGQRHRPVRPVGQRHRLGPQPELERQSRRSRYAQDAGGLRRGHRELHERRHLRHRHRTEPR